jgi:hypothetical protein
MSNVVVWWMLWVYGVCGSNKIYFQCSFWTKSEGEYTEKHQQEKKIQLFPSLFLYKKRFVPEDLSKNEPHGFVGSFMSLAHLLNKLYGV